MKTILTDMPTGTRLRHGKCAVEIGYPWISRGAIVALETVLRPHFSVLEVGCGGSTVFFASRCKEVNSFDGSQAWIDRVREKLGEKRGVRLTLGDYWSILIAVKKEPDGKYDVAFVDIGKSTRYRRYIATACLPKLRKGGYLVVDNYDTRNLKGFSPENCDTYTFDDIWDKKGSVVPYPGKGAKIFIKR